jgi:hypothetical protein
MDTHPNVWIFDPFLGILLPKSSSVTVFNLRWFWRITLTKDSRIQESLHELSGKKSFDVVKYQNKESKTQNGLSSGRCQALGRGLGMSLAADYDIAPTDQRGSVRFIKESIIGLKVDWFGVIPMVGST